MTLREGGTKMDHVPETYGCGRPTNTPAQECAAWNRLLGAAKNGDTVRCRGGSVYNLDLEEPSVVISVKKTLRFLAYGATWVFGGRPQIGIKLSAPDTIWEGGNIVGGSLGYPIGDQDTQAWRPLYVSGNGIKIRDLCVTNAPTGLEISDASDVQILSCFFRNDVIKQGGPSNNFSAAVKLLGCRNATVRDCTMHGHGQGVLVGTKTRESRNIFIDNCTIMNPSDNGIYVSSGSEISITECSVVNPNATGIKTCSSYCRIFGNTVKTDDRLGNSVKNVTGIIMSGYGSGSGLYNGVCSAAYQNTIKGSFRRGIYFAHRDQKYLRDGVVRNNLIVTTCEEPTRSPVVYGDPNVENVSVYQDNMEIGFPCEKTSKKVNAL